MVVSEAAYPGSIPGGRTSRKPAETFVNQGIEHKKQDSPANVLTNI
jgi:hypothetical protein